MNTRIVEECYTLIDLMSIIIEKETDEYVINNAKKCLVYFVNQLYEEENKNKSNINSRDFYEQILLNNGIEKNKLKELKKPEKSEGEKIRESIINYKLSVLLRELKNVLKRPNFLSLRTWVNNFYDIVVYYQLDKQEMFTFMINNMKKYSVEDKVIQKASKLYLEKDGVIGPKSVEEKKSIEKEYSIIKKKKNRISEEKLNALRKKSLDTIQSNINISLADNDFEKKRFVYVKAYLIKLKNLIKTGKEKIDIQHKINSLTSILLNIKSKTIKKSKTIESVEENLENDDTDIKKGVSLIK
ncbi:MAG: hypothetical protein IJD92_02965 [Bacilli bacterium]|nr:hypothetical protein [Bacilli bacterium]